MSIVLLFYMLRTAQLCIDEGRVEEPNIYSSVKPFRNDITENLVSMSKHKPLSLYSGFYIAHKHHSGQINGI